MKVTLPIPSLTGGVSTQPEPLRLPQQAESSENLIATVIEGLRSRPPTEFQSMLPGFPAAPSAEHGIHSVDGDYLVTATSANIRVYDLADPAASVVIRNTAGGVATAADFDYLQTSDPQKDLRFLTLSDYTLVLNRSKTVLENLFPTPAAENRGLVAVIQGAYRATYGIKVSHPGGDNIEVRFKTHSSDGTAPGATSPSTQPVYTAETSVKTDVIAQELELFLKTGTSNTGIIGGEVFGGYIGGLPPSNWTITRSGSVISIQRRDGTDFELSVSESAGGASMKAVYKKVQLFSDLPTHAPVGMVVEVEGDPEQADVSYWVQFQGVLDDTPTGTFADGSWAESVKPGINDGTDYRTLPHALLRQANGDWQWTPLDGTPYLVSGVEYQVPFWERRNVGDERTNPHPHFIGRQIKDMVFHEGRLGLLGEDGLMLSEAREPFNLYRTSVITLTDTERIELKIPSVHAERLSHALPLGSDIVLFSEGTQYVVRADGPFAPNSVSINVAGRHDAQPDAPPIQVRDSLMVPSNIGLYGAVRELRVGGEIKPRIEAQEITSNVPDYLGRIRTLISTPQLDVMAATSDDEQSLWVFTHFYNADEKIQQAWQKFTFPDSPTIRYAWFHLTDLYLVLDYAGSRELQKIRMEAGASDSGTATTLLDRRVSNSGLTQVLAGGDTTITLPYPASADIEVVEQTTGKVWRVLSFSGNDIVVDGDSTNTSLWIGVPFSWRHDLSRIYMHDDRQVPIASGDLRLDSGALHYSESGPFDVVVTDSLGNESWQKFAGPYLGMGANYQKMRVTSGVLTFPIRSKAVDTRLSFRSSSVFPVRFVSLDIEARILKQHGRRR